MSEKISLYRKYRPENFSNVVGQQAIITTLKNAVINNKISHAYLFSGPRGTGKTSIAKIIAKLFNCQQPIDGEACNKCSTCLVKNSTDIIELDAASNNGVDEIRNIIATSNFVPNNGKYKVYIIDEVHMLSIGAFNALLKTMEEPPPHVIFILATTELNKIPKTILSRCQKYEFKKIPKTEMIKRLKYIAEQEKIIITDEALNELAILSEGAARDGINLLDQVYSSLNKNNDKIEIDNIHELIGTLPKQQLEYFLGNIFLGNIKEVLGNIRQYIDSGKNLIKISEEMIRQLKDKIVEDFDKKEITKKYFEAINIIQENISLMKNSNDIELAFELMILKMISNDNKNNIDSSNKIEDIKMFEVNLPNKDKQEEQVTIDKTKETNTNKPIKTNKNIQVTQEKINIRIGNALSSPSKEEKQQLENILKNQKIDDEKYNLIYPILNDATLMVASHEYLIFTTPYQSGAERFNENLIEIENLIYHITEKKYHVIAIEEQLWQYHKKQFIIDKSAYKYIEEQEEEIKEEQHELEQLLGKDIVEIK